MKKAVIIVGPTAVGKTSLALKLAKKFNSDLISADSVQVFKGLDIISGKDKDEFLGINVKLIDIIPPTKSFSVSQFQALAVKAIEEINKEKKLPIIVGGTGLYVKSLIDGIGTSEIKPDYKLRVKLEKLNLKELQEELEKLDRKVWKGMNESDRKNRRRIIRRIEIFSNTKDQRPKTKINEVEFLQIGLKLPKEKLKENIDKRVDERIKNGGIKEAKNLLENYKNLTQQVKDANGYRQLFEHFLRYTSLKQAIEKWKISEYHHAKNQMTWFKKDRRIIWFEADKKDLFEAVEKKINDYLAN